MDHLCLQSPTGGNGGGVATGGVSGGAGAGGNLAATGGHAAGGNGTGATAVGGGNGSGGASGGNPGPDGGQPDGTPTDGPVEHMDAIMERPECTGPSDCTSKPAKPACVDNHCVACAMDKDCPAGKPACDTTTNTCGPCKLAAACTAHDAKLPLCDATAGTCVECLDKTDCKTDPLKKSCIGGTCFECTGSLDCANPLFPICNTTTHTCGKCADDNACAARDPKLPRCDTGKGTCVECVSSAHCTSDPKKPICNLSTCGVCVADKECSDKSGANPGVCMSHQDGRCATDAETIYVQKGQSCAMAAGGGAGSNTMPFCLPQTAIDSVTPARKLVVLRGSTALANFSASSAGGEVSVIGQNGATINPGTFPGIHVTGGAIYIRGLTVENGSDVGISADMGSTLRLDRVVCRNNAMGGLLLAKAGFEVTNSVFALNGQGTVGSTGWSGVYIGTVASGLPSKFSFNTIVDNKDKGVACFDPSQIVTGSLFSNNTSGDYINCMVGNSKTSADGSPAFDSNRQYHLTPASPCKDAVASTVDHPAFDIDGDVRPTGAGTDCGADEYVTP